MKHTSSRIAWCKIKLYSIHTICIIIYITFWEKSNCKLWKAKKYFNFGYTNNI